MNGDPNNLKRPTPLVPAEDAGSQALAEALRSSFGLIKVVMGLLVLVFFSSGFFTVGPQQRAIILRFGKPVGEGGKELLGPGLHWSFPYPIDEVNKVAITEVQQLESTVGWFAATREQLVSRNLPPPMPSLRPGVDGYVLTADQNIIHVRATLSYNINDPKRFLFAYASATNVIGDALDSALIYAAARFKVDDILRRDAIGFQEAVRQRVIDLLEARQVGVVVGTCDVQRQAPRWLEGAFNQVLQAEQTRSTTLNQARTDENAKLTKASADAASRLNLAESERTRRVESTAADAERFKALLPLYQTNPALFMQQRQIETLARVLPNVEKWIEPDLGGTSRELRVLMNRELPKTSSTPPAAP